MATTTRVCLTQHLRFGNRRTRIESINLSLNDEERNYYICQKDDTTGVKEDYELLSEQADDLSCLAVIRMCLTCLDYLSLVTYPRHSSWICLSGSIGRPYQPVFSWYTL